MHFGDGGVIHQSDPGVRTDQWLCARVGWRGWGLERTLFIKITRLRVLGYELSSSCGSLWRKGAGPQGASLEKVNGFLLLKFLLGFYFWVALRPEREATHVATLYLGEGAAPGADGKVASFSFLKDFLFCIGV